MALSPLDGPAAVIDDDVKYVDWQRDEKLVVRGKFDEHDPSDLDPSRSRRRASPLELQQRLGIRPIRRVGYRTSASDFHGASARWRPVKVGELEQRPIMKDINKIFGEFANGVARLSGKPLAFILAAIVVFVWGVTGPLFNYSDTWQLVINTGTTIITFLMVFLIQNSQNRDNAAIQVKLDELISAGEAQNRFVGIERLTDEEIEELRLMCESRACEKKTSEIEDARH